MVDKGDDLLRSRREKWQRLRNRGVELFPNRYRRTHVMEEAITLFRSEEAKGGEERRISHLSLAGRVTSMRDMGKATFLDLRDGSGKIQVHLRKDILGDGYDLVRDLDLGDFLGAQGHLFRTRTGEITLEARDFTLLAKALRPLPEKWHGLTDVEMRYRQRYLDLIANDDVQRIFRVRNQIISSIRRFLDSRGFMEVETPILLPIAAGAMARPFATRHHALNRQLYLRIATELPLKRLIIGGYDKVYELGRVFRNEGIDIRHNPEFTTLESYEAYADYQDVMSMVEEMVYTVAQEVLGTPQVEFGDTTIDFTPPWKRVSLQEEVQHCIGIDFQKFTDASTLAEQMKALGIPVEGRNSRGRLIDKLVSARVEPKLMQPTFLMDYPVEMSPLAKQKPDNPSLVERFEAFAGGMEIGNAFTELNDPEEQRRRFMEQEALRAELGEEEVERLDEDFLLALEHGMPPTGGLGMGIDRLAMLLTGQTSIREVILFPQMREK